MYELGKVANAKRVLENLGVDKGGISIMSSKMELFWIYIKDLRTPAANILKQDALSIGAELATPSGVIACEGKYFDCILIGTRKHLEQLSRKELAQPFGLKEVALKLKEFLVGNNHARKIMGIVNLNTDSFYPQSRFDTLSAIGAIEKMIDEGADIIDIGAVSSRPNSSSVSLQDEMNRVVPICDAIYDIKLYEKALFSIDSYTPQVVEYALTKGFGIINDITGGGDNAIIELACKYHAKLCIMHMQGTPQTMQQNPTYEDVVAEVSEFFERRIAKCEAIGLERKDIILDVGIGFGKNLEHNLSLLRNMRHFTHFGCEVLVGASRKSMIDKITPSPTEERLAGTLALHLKAYHEGASIFRVHDVAPHVQAMAIWERLHQ